MVISILNLAYTGRMDPTEEDVINLRQMALDRVESTDSIIIDIFTMNFMC